MLNFYVPWTNGASTCHIHGTNLVIRHIGPKADGGGMSEVDNDGQ